MDNYQFGSAYGKLPEKRPPSNPERREILEAPRKWMHFFDETMHNYLAGESAPERADFVNKMEEYFIWSQFELNRLEQRGREIHDASGLNGAKNDITTEFRFHHLNGPMIFLWYQLLYPEDGRLTRNELSDMQTHLAITMVPFARRFKQLDEDPKTRTSDERAILAGTLNEADTAITLIELMKDNPDLVVVPAPELFEHTPNHSNARRNSDLLLIDTAQKQARGVQAKTRTLRRGEVTQQYDHRYVTVVDGVHDLGNTTFANYRSDRTVQLPGQIAMHVLAERPIKAVPQLIDKKDFLPKRLMAQELTRGRKSFLGRAVVHVADRLIPELYMELETKNHPHIDDEGDKIA